MRLTDFTPREEAFWQKFIALQGQTFRTARGLDFTFRVQGGELFFDRKEKSITKATVIMSYRRALDVQAAEGCVSGPKKLGTFGASYLYPVFLRMGICTANPMQI